MSDPMDPVPQPEDDAPDPENGEWEHRVLCVDESCIGTIGPDGKCRVCGREYPNWVKTDSSDMTEPRTDSDIMDTEIEEPPLSPNVAPDESDEWSERRLCPDDSCIGTIGPDGKCRVCGRIDTRDH